MSFRNRCSVLGANGPIHLTIPIAGGRETKREMRVIKIDYTERWQLRHWKTIESCYNRSPFFDHYRDSLEKLYRRHFDYLLDWNMSCLEWVCDKLSIKTICTLNTIQKEPFAADTYTDMRGQIRSSAMQALDPSPHTYQQVFGDRFGFIPYLSVLDKLFCEGAA